MMQKAAKRNDVSEDLGGRPATIVFIKPRQDDGSLWMLGNVELISLSLDCIAELR